MIPKPTLWAFSFFANLCGEPVYRDERLVLLRRSDGSYEGVAWNLCRETREAAEIDIRVPGEGAFALLSRTVDETVCNPLKVWHDMGEPASLTCAQPLCQSEAVEAIGGEAGFALHLRENAVVHFTLAPVVRSCDPGYDYAWYLHRA